MAKFILPYNISSTLQSLRDSPRWGYWGPYSPAPLRRSAPMGLFWVRSGFVCTGIFFYQNQRILVVTGGYGISAYFINRNTLILNYF